MKYYLVIVQNDSTQSVFAYNTLDQALAAFHTELAFQGEGRDKTLCIIFDSNGARVRSELWQRSMTE